MQWASGARAVNATRALKGAIVGGVVDASPKKSTRGLKRSEIWATRRAENT